MKTAFVTVLNDAYILGALTTFYSLVKNTPNFNCDIIILDWGDLSDNNKQKLKNIYKNIIFRPIDVDLYNNCKYDSSDRKWYYNCNYRFDIFCIQGYDKLIFIDTDFLIQISVQPLIDIDCNFGVVKSLSEFVLQYSGENCFDAGLMIIGKKYLDCSIRDKLIKLSLEPAPMLANGSTLWTSDEPILNTFFSTDKTMLEDKFNYHGTWLNKTTDIYNTNFQFNGVKKPWLSSDIYECFNEHTVKHNIEESGTSRGLLIMLRLHKIYLNYMNEAIKLSQINDK